MYRKVNIIGLINSNLYKIEIEKEHGVSFKHTLVLTRITDDYIRNIDKRGLIEQKEELIKIYKWRLSNINLYDNIVFNDRKNV